MSFNFYRPQRSCGQGNIFTPVCHSFCSQGGGCLPQCMLGYDPPGADTPLGADTPRSRPPPGKYASANGLRAAGTHPTWMHSCLKKSFVRTSPIFVPSCAETRSEAVILFAFTTVASNVAPATRSATQRSASADQPPSGAVTPARLIHTACKNTREYKSETFLGPALLVIIGKQVESESDSLNGLL